MMGNFGASKDNFSLKTEERNEQYRELLEQKQELTNEMNNF